MHFGVFWRRGEDPKSQQNYKFQTQIATHLSKLHHCDFVKCAFKKNCGKEVVLVTLDHKRALQQNTHSSNICVSVLKHLHAAISGWFYDIKLNVTNIVSNFMKFFRRFGSWTVNRS